MYVAHPDYCITSTSTSTSHINETDRGTCICNVLCYFSIMTTFGYIMSNYN